NTPNQDEGLRNAGIASDIDGISGRRAKRAGSSTARILMALLSLTASAFEIEMKAIGMCPATTSCKAGATPRYGTWLIFTPAVWLNSSPIRWKTEPTPEEP